MSGGLIDWGLARTVARGLAREGEDDLSPAEVEAAGEEARERVLAYTTLEPRGELPGAESVGRAEWIEANSETMAELAEPLERRVHEELDRRSALGGLARGAVGAAGGLEAGAVLGYAARRVLGQYHVALTGPERPGRLLVLGGNVAAVADELELPRDRFLLWVAVHEWTHAIQFASVPWLRERLGSLASRLVEAASGGLDAAALRAALGRVFGGDPREALRRVLRGELVRALAGPEQGAILDELQATMAVVEGHAEHVMDAAVADDESLVAMRSALARRRARGGLADAIARALGLGMKLRQYELGKSWADAVAERAGTAGLERVWSEPASLPTLAELEAPERWLERTGVAAEAA